MDRLSFKSQGVRRRYDLLLLTILESFTEGLFLFVFAKDIICTLTLVALALGNLLAFFIPWCHGLRFR